MATQADLQRKETSSQNEAAKELAELRKEKQNFNAAQERLEELQKRNADMQVERSAAMEQAKIGRAEKEELSFSLER